jgi:pimeloyl-ACP methyl ester carboxylesterase
MHDRRIHRSRVVPPRFGLLLVLLALIPACSKDGNGPTTPTTYGRGEIIAIQVRGSYSLVLLEQMLAATGVNLPAPLTYPVDAYRITYATVDANDAPLPVSGALLVPRGAWDLPLASIQHGTETDRERVASTNPLNATEGIVGLFMASYGYLVVVPDYPGFGVSEVRHPYLHAASLVPCVIDLLRAARSWTGGHGITLNGQVFLTGYSEGGFTTLAAQKAIEQAYGPEFTLTAVAPMAGPYDLLGTTRTIFETASYGGSPAYLAYVLSAYDFAYGWDRLGDFFNAPYADLIPGLFDGTKTWGEIESALPATFSGLMRSDFVTGVVGEEETAILAALAENTLLDWRPVTPIHFIHGTADEVVPYQNTLTAVSAFTDLGATDILFTPLEGKNHETAGPIAVVAAITWFESFRTGGTAARVGG